MRRMSGSWFRTNTLPALRGCRLLPHEYTVVGDAEPVPGVFRNCVRPGTMWGLRGARACVSSTFSWASRARGLHFVYLDLAPSGAVRQDGNPFAVRGHLWGVAPWMRDWGRPSAPNRTSSRRGPIGRGPGAAGNARRGVRWVSPRAVRTESNSGNPGSDRRRLRRIERARARPR